MIFIHPRHTAYAEASKKTRDVFRRYSDVLAFRSLDEAYLDLGASNLTGLDPVAIAKLIRKQVESEVGITCSAGVAPNMMLAKIASDYRKPNSLTVVRPSDVTAFLENLPLRKIPGIGPATEKRISDVGLHLCKDVWKRSLDDLQQLLGERMGRWIFKKSRGHDNSDVGYSGERKTYGAQRTIGSRHHPRHELEERLRKISKSLAERMEKGKHVGRTITLKLRYGDLRFQTRSKTLDNPVADAQVFFSIACSLMQGTPVDSERVRLVGLSVSNLVSKQTPDSDKTPEQQN